MPIVSALLVLKLVVYHWYILGDATMLQRAELQLVRSVTLDSSSAMPIIALVQAYLHAGKIELAWQAISASELYKLGQPAIVRVARTVCCEHMYATPDVVFRHLQHESRCLGSMTLLNLTQATLERGDQPVGVGSCSA
eukprot:m.243094 g.243094  ORF g.243094 m.243094 type:complete len:138 (-) comp17458_c0_seq6:4139-4552(-)